MKPRLPDPSSPIPLPSIRSRRCSAVSRAMAQSVIDDRHQRASTILATQIPIECWHDTIGEPTTS